MDSIGVQVAVLLAILLLLILLLSARRRVGTGGGDHHGTGSVVTWLVLTALVLWCGAIVSFAAVHALLFAFGTGAAAVGLVVSAALLVATPFALAVVVRRATHDLSAR